MKRPEVIWISGMPFDVHFDHVMLATIIVDDGAPPAVGTANADKLIIVIDERLPIARQRDVLMHEVLHGIVAFTALRNVTEPWSEELVVDVFATQLAYVLRVNPELVEFILHPGVEFIPDSGGGEDTQTGEGES